MKDRLGKGEELSKVSLAKQSEKPTRASPAFSQPTRASHFRTAFQFHIDARHRVLWFLTCVTVSLVLESGAAED